MSLKDQLTKLVGYMQIQMVGYPDFLTREQLEASGKVDAWSAKDNLFHCLFWAGNQLEILETLEKGEAWEDPENNDYEAVNKEKFLQYETKSWEDGREMVKEKYKGMMDYLDRITDDSLQIVRKERENPIWREMT